MIIVEKIDSLGSQIKENLNNEWINKNFES
jgi:hypothetical protein